MAVATGLQAHLDSGATTLCRCWELRRRDGAVFGFTDHDLDLVFDGVIFRADSGLTAEAMQQTTGLATNNTEVVGAFRDVAVTDADLAAGRFDGAEVWAWLVNWADPAQRHLLFRGSIGEIRAGGGEFRAELRGLTDSLNRVHGRAYQPHCGAVLGDRACRIDLAGPAFAAVATVAGVVNAQELVLAGAGGYADRWFERGRIQVLSGAATGLDVFVKADLLEGSLRRVFLWQELRAPVAAGDSLKIEAGCDKRFETCRDKFANTWNFRGFPHIPGEDWMMAYPKQSGTHDGGSRTR